MQNQKFFFLIYWILNWSFDYTFHLGSYVGVTCAGIQTYIHSRYDPSVSDRSQVKTNLQASQVHSGKNLPASAENVGPVPGQEDPLEKEMTTHSSILAWKIP